MKAADHSVIPDTPSQPDTETPAANTQTEATFWDHLEALRSVVIKATVILAVATVGLFIYMPEIFDRVILAPCRTDFPLYHLFDRIASLNLIPGLSADFPSGSFAVQLINVDLSSQFMLHISTSFWLAIVVTAPCLIALLWGFVSPALYRNERLAAATATCMATLMFYIGVAISYFLVFPLTLRFLSSYQLSPMIPNVISIDSYMDTIVGLSLVMGLTFELPIAAWLLGRIGLLHRSFFNRYRRHAIVALVTLAAIITPTGDPVTLAVVFLPLYLLWELSACLVKK